MSQLDLLSSSRPAPRGGVAPLGNPERVWAVGPVYGRYGALCQLHEFLARQIRPGDRIVYLGNYLGTTSQWSGEGKAVLSELVAFKEAVISIEGFKDGDVVHLRGRLEDLCRKLMRLPFEKNPLAFANDMMEKGLGAYLAAYNVNPQALIDAAGAGVFVANRFTYYWQRILNGHPEHAEFLDTLNDSACTQSRHPIAFIPEGLDPRLPLSAQREILVWPPMDLGELTRYFNYARVVRGSGIIPQQETPFLLTLEGGNRLDGALHTACLNPRGYVIESLTF